MAKKKENTLKKKPVVKKSAPKKAEKPKKAESQLTIDDAKQKQPRSEQLIHQILPFVWFCVALFLLLCIVPRDIFQQKGELNWLGPAGEFIHSFIFGLFGWGAFLIPAIFVYLGIMWRRLLDKNKLGIKITLASLIMLLVSALAEVFVAANIYEGLGLYAKGGELIGGGLVGGTVGWCLHALLKEVGSIIVIIAVLIIIVCLFFDMTPYNVWTWIRYKNKVRMEKRQRMIEEQLNEEERLEREAEREKRYQPQPVPEVRADSASELTKEAPTKPVPDEIPEEPTPSVIVGDEEIMEDQEAEKPAVPAEKPTEKPTVDPVAAQIHANDDDDDAELDEPEGEFVMDDEETEETVIPWVQPPIDLLNPDPGAHADQSESIAQTKAKLRGTLESFGVRIKDIGYSVGPTITRYEVFPEAGVRVKQIANLVDDIAMSLATVGVRIEAPIPNKPAVGVEVPNEVRANVYLKTLIDDDQFWNASPLTVCLGQDVAGKNVYFDIKKMPHMIIAGTTGSGKSVCINCIVSSLLYKNPPDKVKLIMIDPKKVEFTMYQHIPHLYCPIISDTRKAAGALASAVTEMERRYTLVEDVGVRDIDSYNKVTANDPDREYLPKLIIIIDELADLMMTAKADVEQFITRIAQKARAVGIHLILGTQRPSVDVITGLIKANVPSRIACTVKSQVDSRTIIDISGAEKLIGRGDMLFSPVGMTKPMRVQGAFLEDDEVRRVVDFIKDNSEPVSYNRAFMDNMDAAAASMEADKKGGGSDFTPADGGSDDKFRQALEIAVNEGKISTSLLQRKLSIGYGKAAKIIDEMEEAGYVSAADGNKPRRILITKQEFYEKALNDELKQ